MTAVDILQEELKKVYQAIEMSRTHAENFTLKAKEYSDGVVLLENRKRGLIEALEKLKS